VQIDVPHFSIPFHFHDHGGGVKPHVVEQDTIDEIFGCVEAVVRTELGTRIDEPEFGVASQEFIHRQPDLDAFITAVSRWEPRASVSAEEDRSAIEDFVMEVHLQVSGSQTTQDRGERTPYA
jgi:phage baseplate assembly protein W